MSFSKVIFAWFACAPLAYAGNGLVVSPGQSVTLVDASDPSMHIVVSAPADAALDLGALLAARGKASILSIVTGAQVKSAGSMVKSPDGTISITAAPAPAAPQALLADRAVLVFNEGRYVGVAQQPKMDVPVRDAVNLGALVPAVPRAAPARLPGPAPVVSGTPSINPASKLAVNPTTPGVINWSQFKIGSSGTVNVSQPGASSITLNRVSGNASTPNIATGTGSISLGGGNITTSGAPASSPVITVK